MSASTGVSKAKYYLGVDGGSTKTHTVCMKDGVIIGEYIGSSTNINSIGREKAFLNFEDSVLGAIKKANIPMDEVAGIGVGMSGVDTAEEVEDRKKMGGENFPEKDLYQYPK